MLFIDPKIRIIGGAVIIAIVFFTFGFFMRQVLSPTSTEEVKDSVSGVVDIQTPLATTSISQSEALFSCLDSDTNEKIGDIFIKGQVVSRVGDGSPRTVYDECIGDSKVKEIRCTATLEGNGFVEESLVQDCPDGCFDGACKLVKKDSSYVRVIAPNGGETLCMGSDFHIQWEGYGIRAVKLSIKEGAFGSIFMMNSYPATFNEKDEKGKGLVVWKVGSLPGGAQLREGFAYEFLIDADSNDGQHLNDRSDELFSIIRCEG